MFGLKNNHENMKTKIYNLIILDASGSMQCIKNEAIGGFNETVQTIRDSQCKHEDQEHLVSLVVFNSSKIDTVYEHVPVSKAKELNEDSYVPSCATPLYDAIGYSLNALRRQVEDNDRVLVTVITDGYENSSAEYSGTAVKALVDELKGKGWVFSYIGANQDAFKEAASIAIMNSLDFDPTGAGIKAMFAREKKSRTRFFDRLADNHNQVDESMNENYFKED